ncbi:carbohydrate sulfotransferase 1-like [Haliotis rubra]|uniref:carbohydrate sulfotransferase 1-like n=1 Tax=Haliotis rubra TaxID=36100 RepID=UPI001EE51E98|nr:carbohydrate sulfotransferase 1-like [Haliotis rubra]
MVVLLTYMRSGSTFTGDVIQNNPDVFYVFEPLHSIERFRKGKMNLMFLNEGLQRRVPSVSQKTLENFLTCNMRGIDVYTLGQRHMHNSIDTRDYDNCRNRKPGILGTLDCLPVLERHCVRAPVSCVKTIRFNMTDMRYLMNKHKNIKIIHLIRDPRATLRSQKSVGQISFDSLDIHAENFCQRVKRDLDVSSEIKPFYPQRILTVRYEDLAERPFETTEHIYRFLGLNLTTSIRDYVQNITSGSGNICRRNSLCTNKNSRQIVSKWRTSLLYSHVAVIDKICEPLYKMMGYLPANEHNLRNLSVPMYTTRNTR